VPCLIHLTMKTLVFDGIEWRAPGGEGLTSPPLTSGRFSAAWTSDPWSLRAMAAVLGCTRFRGDESSPGAGAATPERLMPTESTVDQ
jgi:hypothetical protein